MKIKLPIKIIFNYGDGSYTVYLKNFRICGPKPSGDSVTVLEKFVNLEDVQKAIA